MLNLALFSIWFFIFTVPGENLFLLPGVGSLGRIAGLLSFVIGVTATIVLKRRILWGKLNSLMFVFVLWIGFTYFWSFNNEQSLDRVITFFQLFVMVWLVNQWSFEKKHFNMFLFAYVLGAFVSAFATVINYFKGVAVVWQRYSALGFNPNDLAIILALGFPISLHLFAEMRAGWIRLVCLFYCMFAPFAIILTGSRNGLIALALAVGFVLFKLVKFSLPKRIAMILVVTVTLFGVAAWAPVESLDRLSTTGDEIAGGTLNARFSIWWAGLQLFAQNPVLGVGAGNFADAVEALLGVSVAPHNVYLSILVDHGIVGFTIFSLIVISAFYRAYQLDGSSRGLWISVLIILFISAMASNWEWRKQLWLMVTFVFAQHRLYFENEDQYEKKRKI